MKLALALSLLALLSLPASAINLSKVTPSENVTVSTFNLPDVQLSSTPINCMTVESMFEWAKNKREVWTLTPSGQKELRDKVNMNKSRANKPLLSDEAVFYFIPGIDPMNTGVTYFDHGCSLEEMTLPIDSAMLAVIFNQAGVTAEEIIKAN